VVGGQDQQQMCRPIVGRSADRSRSTGSRSRSGGHTTLRAKRSRVRLPRHTAVPQGREREIQLIAGAGDGLYVLFHFLWDKAVARRHRGSRGSWASYQPLKMSQKCECSSPNESNNSFLMSLCFRHEQYI